MHLNVGQALHARLCAAIETGNLAALASFYRPDAVEVSVNTGQIFRGRDAILAGVKQTLDAAGPVKPTSIESIVEGADFLAVEATQSTRYGQIQTYDVYLLQAGLISHQFSGMISPRQPAAARDPHASATAEQRFYSSYVTAVQAGDIGRRAALLQPDAVEVAVSSGGVQRGREAITGVARQSLSSAGPPRLKALTGFVEAPGLLCTEVLVAQHFALAVGRPVFEVQMYEIFVLQEGAIRYQFAGMIAPRPAELRAALKRISDFGVGVIARTNAANQYPRTR